MIDLTKGLPSAIKGEDGNPILLNTDFRYWIQFNHDLESEEEELDVSYLFKDDAPIINEFIYRQLLQFLYNPSTTPKSDDSGEKVLDYIEDGEYIFSALYAVYGIDITEMEMHWHKFQALCNNVIGDNTLWGYAKSVRAYTTPSKNDTMDKQYKKARNKWSFPIKLTKEEKEKVDEFNSYFG